MAIDNFCEGKSMVTTDYEILKKAAAELNEIMHAAHINASDRAIYVSGMLLSMYDDKNAKLILNCINSIQKVAVTSGNV